MTLQELKETVVTIADSYGYFAKHLIITATLEIGGYTKINIYATFIPESEKDNMFPSNSITETFTGPNIVSVLTRIKTRLLPDIEDDGEIIELLNDWKKD